MLSLHAFVLVGAFLLFMLQPLVGRLLLPSFGGGFQIWTACVMFFQGVLLMGYAYAHLVLPRIGRSHLVLVGISLLALPIGVHASGDSGGGVAAILSALLTVALPFAVLATTGVAAQVVLARSNHAEGADPYFLYALSNGGSLIGLLSYPFLIEPWIGLSVQRTLWSAGYVLYALLALLVWRRLPASDARVGDREGARPRASAIVYWLALSATGVVLMLGVTNLIALGAGSIPLVWVLPLAIYLSSFIVAFRRKQVGWLGVRGYLPEITCVGLVCFIKPGLLPELVWIVVLLGSLFVLCFIAHAELYATRPVPGQLTSFYLAMASGGFCGGSFVTLAAPAWFTDIDEYPFALVLLALTLAIGRRQNLAQWLRARTAWAASGRFHYGRWLRVGAIACAGAWLLTAYLVPASPHAMRNPYGIYSVWDRTRGAGSQRRTLRILSHNRTNHGFQSLRPDERYLPTGNFHRDSPLGELLAKRLKPARYGVVGLGAGTLASYFGSGEELTFYEIDADTERLARAFHVSVGFSSTAAGRAR